MSGLLHRLGARAIGHAWSVRSDAALPFAGGRWAESAVEAAERPSTGVTLSPPVARRPDATAPEQAPASAAPRSTETAPSPRMASSPRWPQPLAPTPAPDAAVRPDPVPARSTLVGPVPRFETPPPESPHSGPTRDGAMGAAPALQVASRSATEPKLPAPLMRGPEADAAALTTPPPWRTAAAQSLEATQAMAARTPPAAESEVHIHIGRIEVTALQEAPRPKAKPREPAQPMSLETYLQQRRKAS